MLALTLCVAALVGFRMHAATHGLRYVGHPDEKYLFAQADVVLSEPGFNPQFFRYPSLPIYLTAGAIQLRDALGPVPPSEQQAQPGRTKRSPHFSAPRLQGQRYEGVHLVAAARLFFAALGAAVFLWVGLVAREVGARSLFFVAPLVLATCRLIQRLVVSYQNVDTPTLFFAFAGLACMLVWFEEASVFKKAVIPGVLCGLTTACKYNSGILILSAALAIMLAPGAKRVWRKLTVLGLSAACAFFVAVPYSLLDFAHFKQDVLFEMRHYQKGHPGFESPPGLPQLVYYATEIYKDYGPLAVILAALGIPWSFAQGWRKATVALVFPALMLLHMSTNRVHFTRTIAPVFACVAVYAALGVDGLSALLKRFSGRLLGTKAPLATTALVLVLFALGLFNQGARSNRLLDRNLHPDSRDLATDWVKNNTQAGTTVFVARDLWLSPQDLPAHQVVLLPPALRGAITQARGFQSGVVLLPVYGAIHTVPGRYRRNAEKSNAYKRASKARAKVANTNVKSFVQQLELDCSLSWPGSKASLTRSLRTVAEPRQNPAIRGCVF